MRVKLGTSVICTLLALVSISCQHESRPVSGGMDIRPDVPPTTLVGRARVFQDGRFVATLKTYRFEDGSQRTVTRVIDLRENSLGFITDRGVAYRHTAHGGTDPVANSDDQRRNVAAVMGMPTTQLTIEQDR